MQIRDGLYRTLRSEFGSFERELSPHWRGESARHTPLRKLTVVWTLLGVLLLVLALGYLLFTIALNRQSDGTLDGFGKLSMQTPSLALPPRPPKPAPPIVTAAPKPAPPPVVDQLGSFVAFLQPEVERKLVTLSRKDRSVLVRINNAGLFDSGKADVKPAFRDLLTRIGAAIASEKFKAVVIGHTDNVQIRTLQYPSNWHLSEARARAVATILSDFTGPGAVTFEGRADTEPVGDNATAEGREANRRTEILVSGAAERAGLKPPEQRPEPASR
jgi:type VI secretion system protein ImpK